MAPKFVVPITFISRIDIDSFQDLYPTYLRDSKNFSEHDATIATIIGNCVSNFGYILVVSNLIPSVGSHLVSYVFLAMTKAHSFSEGVQ